MENRLKFKISGIVGFKVCPRRLYCGPYFSGYYWVGADGKSWICPRALYRINYTIEYSPNGGFVHLTNLLFAIQTGGRSNNSNQYKWTTVNSLCPVIIAKELAMVNIPLLIWIDYSYWLPLVWIDITNLTNLLNDLTYLNLRKTWIPSLQQKFRHIQIVREIFLTSEFYCQYLHNTNSI